MLFQIKGIDQSSSTINVEFMNSASDATFRVYNDGDMWIPLGNIGFGRDPVTNRLEVNGDASKTTAGDWLANSDKRIKTDIKDIDNSIETVMKLHPVKFKYTEEWKKNHSSIKDQYYYNFIAQEYKEIFPESVQGSGEFLEGDKEEILQMESYSAQIVTIKAVQELIKQNQEQKEMIENLKNKVIQLENCCQSSNKEDNANLFGADIKESTKTILYQNNPNPFYEQTAINYYLANDVNNASLIIFDMNGKQIKKYTIADRGNGNITINSNELAPGMYMYTLVTNNKETATKRMILTD